MRAHRSAVNSLILGAWALMAVPGNGVAQEEGSPEPEMDQIEVVVANNAFQDMHVYVVQSGLVTSLGTVTGLREETFALSRRVAESGFEFRLLADPIGGFGSYLSDPVLAGMPDEVDLTIQNDLNLSNISVRRVE